MRTPNAYFYGGEGPALLVKEERLFSSPSVTYVDRTGKVVLHLDFDFWVDEKRTQWRSGAQWVNLLVHWEMASTVDAKPFSEGLAAVRVCGDAFLKAWRDP